MYSINRQVAVIKPKTPYVDWINSLPDMDEQMDIEDLRTDCTAILLPHFDHDEASLKFIKSQYTKIFELELDSWSADKSAWPDKRNYPTFLKWFDIEFHSEILDFVEDAIEKEDY
jgi:hypothetical protein